MAKEATPETKGGVYDLVGHQVEVISMEGPDRYVDTGIMEWCDGSWIQLRKKNNDVLCFPIYNVRLVKSLDKS